jgi:cytochrome b-561
MTRTDPPPSGESSGPAARRRRLWSLDPKSDREAGDAVAANFLLHGFPAKVFRRSLDWSTSLGLGTVSGALLLLLTLSGLPLLLLYVPSVERAYRSVTDIEYVVSFGRWIRAVHRVSAHLMVAAVFLHLVRVFLTGAYKNGSGRGERREWNWVIGVAMLLLTLLLSFTGYLLPWDQLAYWAVTIGTQIAGSIPAAGPGLRELLLGGRAVDQTTLLRFYVLHCVLFPLGLGVLFAYHMWRIRKDGGLAKGDREALLAEAAETGIVPTKTYTLLGVTRGTAPIVRAVSLEAPGRTVNSANDLLRRIAIVVLGTVAVAGILAVFVPSPLEGPANALVTPNPAKAPWYFLWLQEIVTLTTVRIGRFTVNGAFLGGVLLPGLLLALLTAWPWLDRSAASGAGVWFAGDRKRQNAVFLAVCLLIVVLTVVGTFLRGPYWHLYWPWQPWPDVPTRI